MTKEDVIDMIRDTGYGMLATLEGKQPRVRPMMPYLDEETGEFLVALLSHSRTINQIKENPLVELCYLDRKMSFCRISGKANLSENMEKKERVWNNIPMLRQYFSGPQDSNFILVEIQSEHVEAMTPHQPKPDTLTLK